MITVTVTPLDVEPLAAAFLTRTRRVVGFDRVYRLYRCDVSLCLRDLDGSLLVESRVFDDEADAQRWVEEDDRQRRLLQRAEVKP